MLSAIKYLYRVVEKHTRGLNFWWKQIKVLLSRTGWINSGNIADEPWCEQVVAEIGRPSANSGRLRIKPTLD